VSRHLRVQAGIWLTLVMGACSGASTSTSPDTSAPQSTTSVSSVESLEVPETVGLSAGAASRSVLPTVTNGRAFVSDAPGWGGPDPSDTFDPDNPGVYVPEWDQGQIDVGNGASDAAWVHDDLRVSAMAMEYGDEQVVLVSADVYMVFSPDADEIAKRAHDALPAEWRDAPVLVAATHNHHGPDTAFSVNDGWYELFATEAVGAVVDAVAALQPATFEVASGEHRFGVNDTRDPVVIDPNLRLLVARRAGTLDVIGSVVQWASHPETTLGWNPPGVSKSKLERICVEQGWAADDCSAEGRYLTADYPGAMREIVQRELGGEVLYLNGAIGSQVGPGSAPTWLIDATHPVGDGWTVPADAFPLGLCESPGPYLCQSFAKTEATGRQLANAVLKLAETTTPINVAGLEVRRQEFFTRLTNIGFRVLIADGDLGWKPPTVYTCDDGKLDESNCTSDEGKREDDPILTPLTDSQVTTGDVIKSRLVHLDLGDVGFLFVPGELPPELVIGLPRDFDTAPEKYYRDDPDLHAVGPEYEIPGYLLSLVDETTTFTVGLGTEELGYFVPISDYRLRCIDAVLPEGSTCADLFAGGFIEFPEAVGGGTCQAIADDPLAVTLYPDSVGAALVAVCRYGQAIGREIGEPEGHYEETNAAGWDLVDDLWTAATQMFGRAGTGRINPDNPGYTPENPPPAG
jgi:hypothetical protein